MDQFEEMAKMKSCATKINTINMALHAKKIRQGSLSENSQ